MAESMKSEENLPVPGVSNALIERLFVYQQQRHLCDVLIITANGYIPAHRIVLVASCPYFNDIDSRQSYLSSSDTNFHLNFDIFDVKLIVKLLYTGKLSVTKENCWRIKKICQFLWLRSAIQVCDEFLSRNFCDENFENERIFSNDTTNFNSRLNICEQQENNCDVLESHMNNNSELNTNITSGYKKPAHAIINLTEDEEIYSQDIDKSSVISNSCSDVHNKQNHSSNINTVVENEEDFKFMEDMSSDENLPSEDKSTTDISEVKNYKSLKTAEEEKNSYQNLPYDSSDNSMATNQDDSTVQEDRSANIESDHSSICHDKKLEDPLQPFSASDENGEESDASLRVNKNKRIEDRKCSGELKEISTECALPLSISMLYHPVSSEQQCSIGYSCHECGESCADITKLIQHRRLKHPKIIKYNGCDLCNKQPRKGINLAEHKFKMHNIPFDEKRYQLLRCTVLGCTFNTLLKGHLKAHINGHSKESSFMCDICGKKFKTKFQLSRHKQIHSENRQKFVCYVCGHTFSSNCSLRFHIREIHEKKKKPLKLCHHCPYSCKGNLAFYNHLYKVHNEAPPDGKTIHRCNLCDYYALKPNDIERHKMLHQGAERKYVCCVCKKGFYNKCNLNSHEKLHRAATLRCRVEGCGFSTLYRHHMKSHMTGMHTNTNYKPFRCHLCNHSCKIKGNLTKHLEGKHGLTVMTTVKKRQEALEKGLGFQEILKSHAIKNSSNVIKKNSRKLQDGQ